MQHGMGGEWTKPLHKGVALCNGQIALMLHFNIELLDVDTSW